MLTLRRTTHSVMVGTVAIGSAHPIRIQAMTNTDTANVDATLQQFLELGQAGAELVRVTVNNDAAAQAIPHIKKRLIKSGCAIPLIGDFHYNGHILLKKYRACAEALDKYRINPGNVGSGILHDRNFAEMIAAAKEYSKPIRIGVNWGSVDKQLLTENMAKNALLKNPKESEIVLEHTLVQSAISSADFARNCGLKQNQIIVSIKASDVESVVAVNRILAHECAYPIHLGLTEAGMGEQGVVASSAALAILLHEGIGDTIRVSLTPAPHTPRTREVETCKLVLQSLGLGHYIPRITSCPGCGRAENEYFQRITKTVNTFVQERISEWIQKNPSAASKKIAVMGCVVNGPGESKYANIALSFPGKSEDPRAVVFIDGKLYKTILGENVEDIEKQFLELLDEYFLMPESFIA